jgi:hypothetical protein
MRDQSMTGGALRDAAMLGDEEAVWRVAANEPYGDLAYSDPRSIWPEVLATLKISNKEMAAAIGTCLLEHMLEVDFDFFHDAISESLSDVPMLAEAMLISSKFGQSKSPPNSALFDALKARARQTLERQ